MLLQNLIFAVKYLLLDHIKLNLCFKEVGTIYKQSNFNSEK